MFGVLPEEVAGDTVSLGVIACAGDKAVDV